MLTLNEQEEKAIDKIIAAIADCISLESVRTIPIPASGMSFSGLEIIQSRRQVLHDGEEVKLNVINLIKNCVYNQQNILKNSVFLKKFCFFL